MKKIFAILLCLTLLCIMPVSVFASDATSEAPVETPAETETEVDLTLSQQLQTWVEKYWSMIIYVITFTLSVLYNKLTSKSTKGLVKTLNNNAVAIAENGKEYVAKAQAGVDTASEVVKEYMGKMNDFLEEIRKSAEEKKTLEKLIAEVEGYLKTAGAANKEFANELAELLNLSNIPNSVKDKLFARHQSAVEKLEEQEKAVAGLLNPEEEKKDVEEG